jgi:hypothetical protein
LTERGGQAEQGGPSGSAHSLVVGEARILLLRGRAQRGALQGPEKPPRAVLETLRVGGRGEKRIVAPLAEHSRDVVAGVGLAA